MAATAEQIARLRRMVAEPTTTTYSDVAIQAAIERYPLTDANGVDWWEWDYTTSPPTQSVNDDWVPTYDLNAAAEEIWTEKAAAIAARHDFSADGASYSRSQAYAHYTRQASIYRSRRSPRVIKFTKVDLARTSEGDLVELNRSTITGVDDDVVND